MIFIVPDDEFEETLDDQDEGGGETEDELFPDGETGDKISIDEAEDIFEESKEAQKGELDLEDAPFLEEEEEEEDLVPEAEAEEEPEREKVKKELPKFLQTVTRHKKIFAISSAAAVILLALGLSALILWPKSREKVPEGQGIKSTVAEQKETIVRMEPFWVEYQAGENIRFLHIRLALPTQNDKLTKEIKDKTLILRDSVYYYLKNKPLEFLSDNNNVEILKKDLLTVINQYLSSDQLDRLLIEEYLVK